MNGDGRLVIVGGGPAGLATARSYREAGGEARVTLLTCEAHLPYNRPPLTKEYLRGEASEGDLPLESERWYASYGVEVRLQTSALALDRDRRVVALEGGEELPFDACVLATGARPVRPPVDGADDPGVLVMRTLEDSTRLRERVGKGESVAVIGSGFIGCEAAASLALGGARVTLVSMERSPQQERLGPEVGERIEGWLRDCGVELRLGSAVRGIARANGGYSVALAGGDTISSSTVLLGTGVEPRTGIARRAGLEVEKGILADSSMRTTDPAIFVAGDAARALNEAAGRHLSVEHWGDALEHGRIAGTVIAGAGATWNSAPGFWSTIGDKTLKYWAWGDGWDERRFVDGGESFTVWYGREGTLAGVLTHGAEEDYERGRELLESGAPFSP